MISSVIVEAKLKRAPNLLPKPPRSMQVITSSVVTVGPFRMTSIQGNKYGLILIEWLNDNALPFRLSRPLGSRV
jgi:hypothetical protein